MHRHALRLLAFAGVLYAHWAPRDAVRAVPDALGHVAGFAVLGAAAWGLLPRGSARAATLLAAGLLVAILLEASQPSFGRTSDPKDVLADLGGLALAATALSAWRRE